MSLTNPTALMWLLLAVPVVIFYILKIRLKRVPVSTVIFWRQIFDEKKPRSLWQRLRHLVSLFVQLALLGLLVSALAEPFLASEATHRRRIILVVDNSASMKASDVAPSRLAKAVEEAQGVIQGLRFRDEMAIVSAGTQPRVVCGLTGHQRTLRDALATIPPTDGPGKLKDAIDTARRLVSKDAADGESRVVVLTDGSGDELAKVIAEEDKKPEAERIKLTVIKVGQQTPNVGITRFQVRRSTIDPIGYEVLIEITNHSDEPSGDFRMELTLNDRTADVIPLNLKPGETWAKTTQSTTADGGVLTAKLTTKGEKQSEPLQDALAADNTAVALLPKREKMPVHLHTAAGNLFLQKVLEANALVQLTSSRKDMPKEFAANAIKVFHKDTPAQLPPGNVLVVDPQNDTNLWKLGNKLPTAIVTKQEKDSPYMAHVRLDNVILPDARMMTFTPAAEKPQVLASSLQNEPLITLIERPEGKVLVLTADLDRSELPFRTAFPILVMNTLGVFSGAAGELRESYATGAIADVTLPAGEFVLRSPDGTTRKLPAGPTTTTVGPFDACGVWAVVPPTPNAAPVEEFAVNLMNKAESDLRANPDLPTRANAQDAGLVGGFGGRPIWWYLTIAAFVLAAVEWYLYQRRWIS
ncbi:vWA domain-containing protein [Limnoglobus roseus]|uniref:VWA domain-containing protein n=1 Tax=Limnoglobus roseus TaxID=2598579 RepID=A0A5C1AMB4_9BACT|nr:BatA and WFA domain-containing protein [Limnoglobus roseus]QEL19725.1 VWA domain-containing protein [Limnoglobus roseus]